MQEIFSQMTTGWFHRDYVYTGSVGQLFRFRYEQGKTEEGEPLLHAAVYSRVCYEKAEDVERRDFPWDEEGVEALKNWYEERYEQFAAAHGLPVQQPNERSGAGSGAIEKKEV